MHVIAVANHKEQTITWVQIENQTDINRVVTTLTGSNTKPDTTLRIYNQILAEHANVPYGPAKTIMRSRNELHGGPVTAYHGPIEHTNSNELFTLRPNVGQPTGLNDEQITAITNLYAAYTPMTMNAETKPAPRDEHISAWARENGYSYQYAYMEQKEAAIEADQLART